MGFEEIVRPKEPNLYVFVLNDTVQSYDLMGLMAGPIPRPLPNQHHHLAERIIEVGRCDIFVAFGHHWRGGDRSGTGLETIRVNRERQNAIGCAYAAVLTCFAAYIPNQISLPNYTPIRKDQSLNYNFGPLRGTVNPIIEPDAILEARKIEVAARQAAIELCDPKGCCCRRVRVRTASYGLRLGEGWNPVRTKTYNCKELLRETSDSQ